MTALAIADKIVRQDAEGRFSLNDLHRASGGANKHRPALFLRSDSAKALIKELENSTDSYSSAVVTKQGRSGGTYVCKELVYAYAMWISAAFCVKVIRAYDAGQTGQRLLTPWEEMQALNLRDTETAVRASVGAVWLNDRKRELPALRRARARLELEIQPSLFALQRVMQGEGRR